MGKLTQEERDNLKRIVEKLQKFCHHPKCKYYCQCPDSHKMCKSRLNFFTAIAWEISESIRNLFYINNYNNYHKVNIEREKLICLIDFACKTLNRGSVRKGKENRNIVDKLTDILDI
uniref:Uncharacterized protein n=1 Tax=viral metagenome TaxID=1070528 RepID=A0A6H2A180_9ZZZZ